MRNFALSLYAFHLCQTLTDAADSVLPGADLLWENLIKLGNSALPLPGLKDLKSHLICYHNGNYQPQQEQGRQTNWLTNIGTLELGSIATSAGYKINGTLQPFRLNDTYAIEFCLTPESANIEIDIPQLQHFHPTSLLPASIPASLGQTIWLYAEVDAHTDCLTLAEKCATALLAGTHLNPVLANQDTLFKSLIFKYYAPEPSQPDNPSQTCHIIITFNNSQANTLQLAGEAYDYLLNLLCCQHKLNFIYHESRDRYPQARHLYSQLEQHIHDFPNLISDTQTRLDHLTTLLTQLPQNALDYARCLRDLQAHHTAMATNSTNYQKCQQQIKAIGDIPSYWEKDLKKYQLWQAQIQTDINYLAPGQNLFGQMIETIRGMVEIDQAERDRNREKTQREQEAHSQQRQQNLELCIALVGTGLAVSGISSQVIPQPIQTIINHKNPDQVCPQTKLEPCLGYSLSNILIHIAIGLISVCLFRPLLIRLTAKK